MVSNSNKRKRVRSTRIEATRNRKVQGRIKCKQSIVGWRFGKLVVKEEIAERVKGKRAWLCVCDCGNSRVYLTSVLTFGDAVSCGCYGTQRRKQAQTTHQGTTLHKVEYSIWNDMHRRCSSPSRDDYHLYGGRGVTVCERWDNFAAFLQDMGKRPSKLHSLDRLDVNKGYCPENCRWATPNEQGSNRRNNIHVTLEGQSKTIAEWSRTFRIPYNTLWHVLRRKKLAENEVMAFVRSLGNGTLETGADDGQSFRRR